MYRTLTLLVTMVLLIGAAAIAQSSATSQPAAPRSAEAEWNFNQRLSYTFGLNIGQNMKQQGMGDMIDPQSLAAGIADILAGRESKLTPEQLEATMQTFQERMQEIAQKQMEEQMAAGEASRASGAAYLAENARKEGVTTLESGLQYRVIKSGQGASPKASDSVVAHYEGRLTDGTVFDSSLKRGQPLTIPVNRVIPGWTEALQLMKEGDKWELVIPSDLAYGPNPPQGSPIPPNAVLVFEVELLEVK